MTTNHLSETEVQQYALDKQNCDKEMAAHVQSCELCEANVQAYLLIFSAIHDQPKPDFDFDLSGLVLQQLPNTKSKFSLNSFLIYFLAFVAVSAIGVIGYLFRKYLMNMFTGILPMTMYLILITAITILIFQSLEMYRKYQKQMNALN